MTYEEALAAIPLGKYRHFKGNTYEVLAIARHSETLAPMVWVRPAEMWCEPAGDGSVRRFTAV